MQVSQTQSEKLLKWKCFGSQTSRITLLLVATRGTQTWRSKSIPEQPCGVLSVKYQRDCLAPGSSQKTACQAALLRVSTRLHQSSLFMCQNRKALDSSNSSSNPVQRLVRVCFISWSFSSCHLTLSIFWAVCWICDEHIHRSWVLEMVRFRLPFHWQPCPKHCKEGCFSLSCGLLGPIWCLLGKGNCLFQWGTLYVCEREIINNLGACIQQGLANPSGPFW